MTISRFVGITSGVGAFLAGLSSSVGMFNPKVGGILAGIGGAITMFCERATGSPEYRRHKREKKIKARVYKTSDGQSHEHIPH